MDTRAIWRDDPMTLTWSLHLVRGARGSGIYEVAVRAEDGRYQWAERNAATVNDDPPLLQLPDWILRDVVLPAAPGAIKPAQQAGRVDALAEALTVERGRVDKILHAIIGAAR